MSNCECKRVERCAECNSCDRHCVCEDGFLACECIQVDADAWDARWCPAHGPDRPRTVES
jgi:hypothetical protein